MNKLVLSRILFFIKHGASSVIVRFAAIFFVGGMFGYFLGNTHQELPVQMAAYQGSEETDDILETPDDSIQLASLKEDLPEDTQQLIISNDNGNTTIETHDPMRPTERTLIVKGGDTLVTLLASAGVDRVMAHEVVRALRKHFNPRRIKPGQEICIALKPSETKPDTHELMRVSLRVDDAKQVHASRNEVGRFSAWMEEKKLTREIAFAEGEITSSLFQASTAKGVPASVVIEAIRALGHKVDLQRDIQSGDRFVISYEQFVDEEGNVVNEGRPLYICLNCKGHEIKLYYHTNLNGSCGFYTQNGENIRKGLMRTPVDGARISGVFGKRKHPILKYTRMHKGIDFAAPRGTPIYASGDGIVTHVCWKGGYGRYVAIKHNNTYTTAYAHLHRFEKGIKVGSRVKQGQIIGRVGKTGLASGCHLHYEVHKHGRQINPKLVKTIGEYRLSGRELTRFQTAMKTLSIKLAQIKDQQAAGNIQQSAIESEKEESS
jgi:murein DD-endopeptidase MepM/ murein hydrolase activator NlpD